MPRYEQYKAKSKGISYTRQIKNESKEINLKKPIIVAAVFIVSVSIIFSIVNRYYSVVDIAIKDFFSINHKEALVLESDAAAEDANKMSFLNSIPLFNFFIKSDTNNTLSITAYETNSRIEASLNDLNDFTNTDAMQSIITRESLIPFFNQSGSNNSILYDSDYIDYGNNHSSIIRVDSNSYAGINNNTNFLEDEKTYNYLEQMILENRKNDNAKTENNINNNKTENANTSNQKKNNIINNNAKSENRNIINNNANNLEKKNSNEKNNSEINTSNTANSIINNTIIKEKNNINNSENNASKKEKSIFDEILKPKENPSRNINTMKPSSTTTIRSTPPNYISNDNKDDKKDSKAVNQEKIVKTVDNNHNNSTYYNNNGYNSIERNNYNNEKNNNYVNYTNNNVSIINTNASTKKEENYYNYDSYNSYEDYEVYKENDNKKNEVSERKEIIQSTVYAMTNSFNSANIDYNRVINDMVNPNPNNSKTESYIERESTANNSSQNNNTAKNINNINKKEEQNIINNKNIQNNNTKNILNNTPISSKPSKKEIMEKAKKDVANYYINKVNNNVIRDFNNRRIKSNNEGIYLVEYDENTGSITLIFRKREFRRKATIEDTIKKLLTGATDSENSKNIISCIPKGTELLDIFVEDSTVYLDFNENFEFNPLGNEGTMVQIYQLVYTATQFEGIDNVIFLINGELNETIGAEGSIENIPFRRFE